MRARIEDPQMQKRPELKLRPRAVHQLGSVAVADIDPFPAIRRPGLAPAIIAIIVAAPPPGRAPGRITESRPTPRPTGQPQPHPRWRQPQPRPQPHPGRAHPPRQAAKRPAPGAKTLRPAHIPPRQAGAAANARAPPNGIPPRKPLNPPPAKPPRKPLNPPPANPPRKPPKPPPPWNPPKLPPRNARAGSGSVNAAPSTAADNKPMSLLFITNPPPGRSGRRGRLSKAAGHAADRGNRARRDRLACARPVRPTHDCPPARSRIGN